MSQKKVFYGSKLNLPDNSNLNHRLIQDATPATFKMRHFIYDEYDSENKSCLE